MLLELSPEVWGSESPDLIEGVCAGALDFSISSGLDF